MSEAVGAVTEAIDSPHVDLGLLGERFVYFRLPPVTAQDEYDACIVVDHNAGRQRDVRAQRSAAVRSLFDALAIPDHLSSPTDDERDRLITLANLGTRCRSAVVRDGYTREIEVVPGHEHSPRLFGQLHQFHAGLALIRTPPEVLRKVLAKAALDGVHPGRRVVMEYLLRTPGAHTTATVAGHCRLTQTPIRRHLQDLMAHGVVELVGEAPEQWSASDWLRERWWAVDDDPPSDPKPASNVLPLRRESIGDLADTEEVLSW